jgi:hypothetical protein
MTTSLRFPFAAPARLAAIGLFLGACGSQEDKPTAPQGEPLTELTAEGLPEDATTTTAGATGKAIPSGLNGKPTAADGSALPEEPTEHSKPSVPIVLPEVKRLVIARGVTDREPTPLVDGHTDEPVTAFLELANETEADTNVLITFEHESGRKVGFIELSVPGSHSRYRTWGRTKHIKTPGTWTAIVSSENGKELAREEFAIASGKSNREPGGGSEGRSETTVDLEARAARKSAQ